MAQRHGQRIYIITTHTCFARVCPGLLLKIDLKQNKDVYFEQNTILFAQNYNLELRIKELVHYML